jgi:hypothetical protein
MIKFGGKSQFVLSRKLNRDFLNFAFLHLAIFSLIFSPHLSNLSFLSSNFLLNFPSNFSPSKNASGKNISLSNTLLNSNNATLLNAQGDVTIANDDSFRDAVNKLAASSATSSSLSSPSLFSTSSIKDEAATARSAATFSAGTDIEINSSGSINVANNYFNTGGSIFMSATNDITNSNYQITASDNVVMSAGNNINNISTAKTATQAALNPTKIEAGSIVSLDAGNNINNIGATIKGGDLVYLTAANNVNNLALINYSINGQTTNKDQTITSGSTKKGTLTTTTISGYTTDSQTGLTSNAITEAQALASNANNIKSTLIAQGSITSNGNVVIVAGNNLNNKASNITANGAAYLEATAGDINISTAQLRDRTVRSWGNKKKSGTNTSDTTTNIESNIVSNGNLDLASIAGDINITGSKLNTDNNLTLTAADDVNISAAQNTSFFESTYQKKGMTVSKSSMSVKQTLTNVKSELDAGGDISITSGENTNLIGVKLAAENAAINAGKEINIFSVADQNYSHSSSSKSRDFSGITNIGTVAMILNTTPIYQVGFGKIAVKTAIGLTLNTSSSAKSNSTTHEKTSNVASIVEATGNLTLASNQNLTISGSNLSAATGNLISNAGSISILSAAETDRTTTDSSKIKNRTKHPGLKGSKKTSETEDKTITNIASNLNFTDSLEVKTLSGSDSDINITGSNLAVSDGDLTLSSTGNINITNAIDSTLSTSSSNKKGNTRKSKSVSGDYVETAAESSLSANNINISSLGDTTVQGSTIDTTNNLIIGSFTIDTNPDGSYKKDEFGNYVTTSGTTVDNLIIKNAELQEYHYAQTSRGYAGIAAVGIRIMPYVLAPVRIAGDLSKEVMSIALPDQIEQGVTKASSAVSAIAFKSGFIGYGIAFGAIAANDESNKNNLDQIRISESTKSKTNSTTTHASTINVGGSMMTNSVGDATIQGSNLNIAGNLLSNSLGNFTISAATNKTSTSSSSDFETAGKFHSDLNVRRVNYKAGVTKDFVEEGETQNSSTLTSSNVNVGGSTLINSSDEFALLASNLITTGSTEINSKNTLNILDGKETQSTSSYLDKLTLDVGVQVGNAYADAVYAGLSAIEALEKVKEAKDKLQKIEKLQDQGLASSKAVERAKYQLVLAMLNAGLSINAALQAAYGAAASSGTAGFYGAVYADITKLKTTTTSEYAQSIASNLISGDSIYLNSGTSNININGSNISSTNSNLNLTAMLGAINIKAGESTYSTESKSRSQSLGGRAGTNGASLNLGFTESASNLDQTTFTNSTITAQNGSLNLNSKTDTNIIGANLLAENINLTVGRNLLVKSKQNLLESDFYSVGANIGISTQSGNSVDGANIGFNMADGFQSKAWVEQLTSIIGTNEVIINTANNTKIVGAEIANIRDGIDYKNLTLNTKSLTFENLKNYNNSESNSLGISLGLGFKDNDPSAPQNSGNNNTQQQTAQNSQATKAEEGVVRGPLKIDLSLHSTESSSTTNATIGKGTITLNGTTLTESEAATNPLLAGLNRNINNTEANKKTVITSDFDASLTVDMRLLAGAFYATKGAITGDATDQAKASNNWNSYVNDTVKGFDKTIGDDGLIGASNDVKNNTTNKNPDGTVAQEGWFPSLLPGLFLSDSKTGKSFYPDDQGLYREQMGQKRSENDPLIGDGKTKPSGLINPYDSNPALASLWHFIPGFKSFTQYHDWAVDHNKIAPTEKASSIPSYLLKNTAGAVGTIINPAFYQEVYRDLRSQPTNNNGVKNE